MKNLTAIILCLAMLPLLLCGTSIETQIDLKYDEESLRTMSAQDYIDTMGIGINLGNTLDSCGSWIVQWGNGTPSAWETAWGNPVTTREMIEYMHSQGFDTIRIPVTWDEHIGKAPSYKIDKAWMDRVEEVVDWALDDGMFVILNLHHDETWISGAASDYATVSARYRAVWEQICERFGKKSYRLVLESNNEVGFSSMSDKAGSELLYKLNDLFIDTVRNSGGKNADRMLLLAGYNTNSSLVAKYFPDDKIEDTRYAVSVHQYGPTTFTIADPGTSWGFRDTWGTAKDYTEMENDFAMLYERFVEKGIPVIIGEYGCSTNGKDQVSRELWLEAVVTYSLEYDMCPILWDAGGEIDRENLCWKIPGDGRAIRRAVAIAGEPWDGDPTSGDINGDGRVNVQDGVLMQRILANLESNKDYISRADLNGDGVINVQDGVKMQRILANLE